MSFEQEIEDSITKSGLEETLKSFLKQNDNEFSVLDLSRGFEISRKRATIYDRAIKRWCKDVIDNAKPNHDYVVTATGGYGSGHVFPNSDLDFCFIIDDVLSNSNPMIKYCNEQGLEDFEKIFDTHPVIDFHNPVKIQGMTGKAINSFFDLRLIYGNPFFVEKIREMIKNSYNPLELYSHNISSWKEARERHPNNFDDLTSFNIKNGKGGIRDFQRISWLMGVRGFDSSQEIRSRLPKKVTESLQVLYALRGFVNLKRENERIASLKESGKLVERKRENEIIEADTMHHRDFRELGDEIVSKLIQSRRAIYSFAEGTLYSLLRDGIPMKHGVVHGSNGLDFKGMIPFDSEEKNDILFYIMHESQKRNLPINPALNGTLFKDIEEWVKPGREFVSLFYQEGSLSKSLSTLANMGVGERLLPYSERLNSVVYSGNKDMTLCAFGRDRLTRFELLIRQPDEEMPYGGVFAKEFLGLNPDKRAALKFALAYGDIVDNDKINEFAKELEKRDFPSYMLENLSLILKNRTLLIDSLTRLNDPLTVKEVVEVCKDESDLVSLLLYTYGANRFEGKNDFLKKNLQELYSKALSSVKGNRLIDYDPKMFDGIERVIADCLNQDFGTSIHASIAGTWIPHLCSVYETGKPVIRTYPSGETQVVRMACKDYPGLLAVFSGQCLINDVNLSQVTAYSINPNLKPECPLALDFFDTSIPGDSKKFVRNLEEAIEKRTFIDKDYSGILNSVKEKKLRLEDDKGSGYMSLEFSFLKNSDRPGILYGLSSFVFKELKGDIYGMRTVPSEDEMRNHIFFKSNSFRYGDIHKIIMDRLA